MDYCFDTVEMMVTETAGDSGDSGDGETHVLVPILSETGVSMILESDLDSDTHYEATLSFNSKPFTSTTFCEYDVHHLVVHVSVYVNSYSLMQVEVYMCMWIQCICTVDL